MKNSKETKQLPISVLFNSKNEIENSLPFSQLCPCKAWKLSVDIDIYFLYI